MDIALLYEYYLRYPSVQTDTRKLHKDSIFFALKGPSFNGNEFAVKAIESGAALAVIDDPSYSIKGMTFLVDDVLTALQQLALHHRQQFNIPFIAITGSNGKTTTKELVHAVLSTAFNTGTTEGNLNNHIGVPLTILKLRPDTQMAVIEMGANHLGEIASYCQWALPTHGLITNCGKAHLEGFGGEEGVRKGKGELFDFLRNNGGTAFIMNDYDYLHNMSKGIQEVVGYGTNDGTVAGTHREGAQFLEVDFSAGFNGSISTKLVGAYNLPNVLAAVTIGKYFDVAEDAIRSAIENYTPTNSRSQLVQKNGHSIILDAYNANPSSMKAAIRNFSQAAGSAKILALGGMAELGAASIDEHKSIIKEIDQYKWKEVLLVGGDFPDTGHGYKKFANPEDAGNWIRQQQVQNAHWLIKGSRSMQMEKILQYL